MLGYKNSFVPVDGAKIAFPAEGGAPARTMRTFADFADGRGLAFSSFHTPSTMLAGMMRWMYTVSSTMVYMMAVFL